METPMYSSDEETAAILAIEEPRQPRQPTIEYTRSTVAWPQLRPSELESWHTDRLLVSYGDGGPSGEFAIAFMTFDQGGGTGVELAVFGDGLDMFYDERIQRVIGKWRHLRGESGRDQTTPEDFIGWLGEEGAEPSNYHRRGMERSEDETASLRAMRR